MGQVIAERGPDTVVGLVKNAGCPDQESWLGKVADIPLSFVDMLTVVEVGNSTTDIVDGHMLSRRGYQLAVNNNEKQ